MRAGAHALELLSAPLNVQTVETLRDGSTGLSDLRRDVGFPPRSTMRTYLRALISDGILVRRQEATFPGTVTYELAAAGEDLLRVVDAFEAWLSKASGGPIPLTEAAGKTAVRSLWEGWSSNIIRALARNPLSLTELDRMIPDVSYPSLERRLSSMRMVGLIEVAPAEGRGTFYCLTDWSRMALHPLFEAFKWEERYPSDRTARFSGLDAETTFLTSVPLLTLDRGLAGVCCLAAGPANSDCSSGVTVEIEPRGVCSRRSELTDDPDAWVRGTPGSWLQALTEGGRDGLQLGGDGELANALLGCLQGAVCLGATIP